MKSFLWRRSLAGGVVVAIGAGACVEPPPKIPAIPASGLALRVHVFGASATDALQRFRSVREKNPSFSVVNDGGDGEVLLGLDNDSPKCVAPTALCSFRVAYRIKDRRGEIVASQSTTVQATSDRCADLCTKALNKVAVMVLEAAAGALTSGAPIVESDAGADAAEGVATAAPIDDASKPKRKPSAKAAGEPAKPDPSICSVGQGGQLPTDEAERRAAQVEALKRQNVLDQSEYDCLRKAYLDRL
ncbi:MAG: hypothetical protein KF819_35825 [Labilithrix sp.]|nr:hypothetical protein [Labilithrix sp.]